MYVVWYISYLPNDEVLNSFFFQNVASCFREEPAEHWETFATEETRNSKSSWKHIYDYLHVLKIEEGLMS